MANVNLFTFSCYISGLTSRGHICAPDGRTVMIDASEMPNLLLDLAADGEGMPGRPKHHSRVLGEWFERKAGPARAGLRLVI